jgi:hypothetical protein
LRSPKENNRAGADLPFRDSALSSRCAILAVQCPCRLRGLVDTGLRSHCSDWSAGMAFESSSAWFFDGWKPTNETLRDQPATKGEILQTSSSLSSDAGTEPPGMYSIADSNRKTCCASSDQLTASRPYLGS